MGSRAGRTVTRLPDRGYRRAEQGSVGPILLEVRPSGDHIDLQIWGPAATPTGEAERALAACKAWAGFDDDLSGFADVIAGTPVLRRVASQIGEPIIGVMPRAAESFGRAVLGQLVQGLEAGRSIAQMVAMTGTPTGHGVWAYPTRSSLGATSAHELRRCGISLRSAGALHAFTVDEARFQALANARDWHAMNTHLRRVKGCGVWTSAETRLYLGDADAISFGDYHIPALVGWALGERTETDEAMAELLAPYKPHRGRVIRLLESAAGRGLVSSKPRRGPRAALSEHRYW